ncbi:SLC13 family permease [Selenomonas ruminantium]|uniref:SLC13 family permease n=1 Tax=Selenomonas ruminantium TaxID=971 RepID=UPI0026EE8F33|nr:SLC13 family permease [Selenomonas ruminantium]
MLIYQKLRKNPDLAVALVFALITSIIAPPAPGDILQRINLPLLGLLLFLMCIVAGLRLSGFFAAIFQHLFQGSASGRSLGRFFIFSCYFSSMFITNDVALIIFVPLAIMVFTEARRIRLMVPTVCWQTIAANLGSMLTPIGNPQNLFIYSHYGLESLEFLSITAPIVLISGIVIYLATYTLADYDVSLPVQQNPTLPWKKILPLLLLFALCLLHVVHLLSFSLLAIIVLPALTLLNCQLFKEADYKLLLLFALLFIGVGNLSHIELFQSWPAKLLNGHEFWVSLLLSQVLSNVPATVLLANYTNAYAPLLLGVNIGGLGTIIASMASVISFKAYLQTRFSKPGYYLLTFTGSNLMVLLLLLLYYHLYMKYNALICQQLCIYL